MVGRYGTSTHYPLSKNSYFDRLIDCLQVHIHRDHAAVATAMGWTKEHDGSSGSIKEMMALMLGDTSSSSQAGDILGPYRKIHQGKDPL